MERKFHREKKTIELIETLVECIEFWSKLCANGNFFYCGISLPYIYFYEENRPFLKPLNFQFTNLDPVSTPKIYTRPQISTSTFQSKNVWKLNRKDQVQKSRNRLLITYNLTLKKSYFPILSRYTKRTRLPTFVDFAW
jgi:hypothetical protein